MPTARGFSPCNGSCVFDPKGYCRVCLRTIQEIVQWSQMTDDQRQVVVDRISAQKRNGNRS